MRQRQTTDTATAELLVKLGEAKEKLKNEEKMECTELGVQQILYHCDN
jgi:hypothetical protein